ncbi:outer-membrane lipoprotein carrier protein [Thalassotalea insulae]|uniref:Outer-membrane lipoprotein carrier protein n=1 Tax=Thalassotalea insulae TaxID=2056778 RepID=A0ABQ6GWJ8_9GAMM|nr:outer membrane lipoprotein chaperone LolA [Thalassotalea insulae]GLX80321.1 outer-membrane lipoprotein carrier protein [Thalassotalea insulae]
MRFQLITSVALVSISLLSISACAEQLKPVTPIKTLASERAIDIDSAQAALMQRLAQTSFFSANFSQQVFDEQHNELQQSQGKLVVKKPTMVYWQTTQPDASLIVSDGDDLWFYDPFIEQATVYTVDASIANTPILLLTSTDEKLWQQYQISQKNSDSYEINSKDVNSRVSKLTLEFVKDSAQLARFIILDSTGQTSVVTLSQVDDSSVIDDKMFDFTLPQGTYLDDQR